MQMDCRRTDKLSNSCWFIAVYGKKLYRKNASKEKKIF